MPQRFYGWHPSRPDFRDLKYAPARIAALEPKADLRPKCPPVWDQGRLGSCTGQGVAALVQYRFRRLGAEDFTPSRLFIYYNERVLENSVNFDSGASIRDGLQAVNRWGAPHEELWPYDTDKFKKKPTKSVYDDGLKFLQANYEAVDNTKPELLKTALSSDKPVVFGFTVYESHNSEQAEKTGVISMPLRSESACGGHCELLVGYDDEKQHWIARNSWSDTWGDQGYCYFPYAYLTDPELACDFWVLN